MPAELRNQLNVPDDLYMAQAVAFCVNQLGLDDQVAGLSLIQKAHNCLTVLGSPLVSGASPKTAKGVPEKIVADGVLKGEVVNPELDELKRQLAIEKERNALLAERERLEKEKAERLQREAAARMQRERAQLAEQERLEKEKAERHLAVLVERERLEKEKAERRQREAEAQLRREQDQQNQIALVEKSKAKTRKTGIMVGATIGLCCAGPFGAAIGMHVGDKWAGKVNRERGR